MSGKEIINGMDQVIQYIQNQDKKIKELQEENEKLCNPNEDGVDYSDVCEYLEYDPNDVIDNLKDEYKRFKATIIMHLGGKEVVGGQYPTKPKSKRRS